MSLDNSFLCYQHCDRNINCYCFTLPENCPICQSDLCVSELRIPPFRISLPLIRGESTRLSLLIKPTNGSFVTSFHIGDALHIGISNSQGKIFDFNQNGVNFGNNHMEWNYCLSIALTSLVDSSLDAILESAKSSLQWTSLNYNEETNNCFDFVLSVLNKTSPRLRWTKTSISHQLILPEINKIIKLSYILRMITEHGVFIQTSNI